MCPACMKMPGIYVFVSLDCMGMRCVYSLIAVEYASYWVLLIFLGRDVHSLFFRKIRGSFR